MSVFALVIDGFVQWKVGGVAAIALSLFGVVNRDGRHNANCTVVGTLLILALLIHHQA